jgi:hypothetical protein
MPDSYALMFWLDEEESNPAVTVSVSLTESTIASGRFTFGFAASGIGHGTAMGSVWNAFVPAGAGLIALVWFAGTTVSGTLQTSVALPSALNLSVATSDGTTVIQTLPAESTDPVSFSWTAPSE